MLAINVTTILHKIMKKVKRTYWRTFLSFLFRWQ